MRIQEAAEKATANARNLKNNHVRQVKGKPGRTDINTFIELYRGNEMVATVFLPPNRDLMLQAASLAARGFSTDVMAVSMETFMHTTDTQTNPVTGKPIEPGDLADLAANHDGIARGWVIEALVTQVLNRAGDSRVITQQYRIHGRQVEWVPLDELVPSGKDQSGIGYGGLVPDSLARAMREDTIDQTMMRHGVTHATVAFGEERARARSDVATVRVMQERLPDESVMVMLAASPGSAREQVIRERFPRSQVIRPE